MICQEKPIGLLWRSNYGITDFQNPIDGHFRPFPAAIEVPTWFIDFPTIRHLGKPIGLISKRSVRLVLHQRFLADHFKPSYIQSSTIIGTLTLGRNTTTGTLFWGFF